jgi:PTS system cellobiose-specific IIB component
MLTITLLCNLGMSTSMLVNSMTEAARKKGIEADIDAFPFDKIEGRIHNTDILLLGPQVRYMLAKFKADYGGRIAVIEVMNMSDYGLVKGEKILGDAIAKYEIAKKQATDPGR